MKYGVAASLFVAASLMATGCLADYEDGVYYEEREAFFLGGNPLFPEYSIGQTTVIQREVDVWIQAEAKIKVVLMHMKQELDDLELIHGADPEMWPEQKMRDLEGAYWRLRTLYEVYLEDYNDNEQSMPFTGHAAKNEIEDAVKAPLWQWGRADLALEWLEESYFISEAFRDVRAGALIQAPDDWEYIGYEDAINNYWPNHTFPAATYVWLAHEDRIQFPFR